MKQAIITVVAVLALALAGAGTVHAAPSLASYGNDGGNCHGANLETCRPDPQPSHGADCSPHGNNPDGNDDHCGPSSEPSSTPSTTPSLTPEPTFSPTLTPSTEPSLTPSPTTSPSASPSPSESPTTTPSTQPSSTPSASTPVAPSSTPAMSMPPTDTIATFAPTVQASFKVLTPMGDTPTLEPYDEGQMNVYEKVSLLLFFATAIGILSLNLKARK